MNRSIRQSVTFALPTAVFAAVSALGALASSANAQDTVGLPASEAPANEAPASGAPASEAPASEAPSSELAPSTAPGSEAAALLSNSLAQATGQPIADAVTAQLMQVAARRLSPKALALADLAVTLRGVADPNYRRAIALGFVASNENYVASMLNLGALYRGSIVRGQLDATLLADTLGVGSAAVQGSFTWDLPICHVLGARGSLGAARVDDRTHLQGYVEANACLPFVVTSAEFRLGARKGLRSTTLDRAILAQGEFDGIDFGLDARAFRMLRARWDLDLWSMGIGVGILDYRDAASPTSTTFSTDFEGVTLHRYGRGLGGGTQTHEILKLGLAVNDVPNVSAVAMNFDLYRFDGVRLGRRLALAAGGGYALASVDNRATATTVSHSIVAPSAVLAVAYGDPARFTETRVASFAQAGNLSSTIEQRITQRFVEQSENLYLDAQIWAGRSVLASVDHERKTGMVWGAAVDASLPVWRGIFGYVHFEASQVVMPELDVTTTTAMRGVAGLTYAWGKDFINHRKPTVDPAWSGPVPVVPQ